MKMSTFFFLRSGCAAVPPPVPEFVVAELVPAASGSSKLRSVEASVFTSPGCTLAASRARDLFVGGDGDRPSLDWKDDLLLLGAGDSGSGEPKRLEVAEGDRDDRLGLTFRGLTSSKSGEETLETTVLIRDACGRDDGWLGGDTVAGLDEDECFFEESAG